MEKNENGRSISMTDLLEIFKRAWIVMLGAAILVGALAFVYANMTYVEEYTATSKYAVLTTDQTSAGKDEYSSGNYSMDLKAVKDVEMLLQTHYVLDEVIELCNANDAYTNKQGLTYKNITKRMTITTDPELTRYIILKVQDTTPENAKILSDAICRSIVPAAKQKLRVDVNDTDVGVDADKPSNSKYGTVVKLLPIVAAMMVYVLFFVIYCYDDKIKTEENVSKDLGLNLLGVVPNIEDSGKLKSRYYKQYYKGKYYRYGDPTVVNAKKGEEKDAR